MKAVHESRSRARLRSCVLVIFLALCLDACSGDGRSPDERVLAAQKLYEQGQYREAIIEMRNLLQEHKDTADARLVLGKALLAGGDSETAQKEAMRARELGASPDAYLETLARALQATGSHVEVVAEVDPRDLSDPELASTLRAVRGYSMLALGSKEQALEVFNRELSERVSVEAQRIALVGKAQIASEENQLELAEKLLLESLALVPNEPESLLALGRIYLTQNKYAKTRDLLESARDQPELSERQDTFFLEAQYTEALLGLGALEEAKASVARLGNLSETHPMRLFLEGRLAFQSADSDAAIGWFQQVLSEYPNYVPALTLMGVAMIEREDVDQAEMFLTRAVANDPSNVRARRLLAETRLRMGRNRAAMRALTEGLSRDDEDPELLTMLGQATLRGGEGEQALEYLHAAYAAAPQSPNAGVVLASAYLTLGNAGEAVNVLRSIPEGAISEQRRRVLVRVAQLDNSDPVKAETQIEQLLQDVGEDDTYITGLAGSFYAATEQSAKARAMFHRILEIDPGNRSAMLSLLHLDERTGDYTESRAEFERAHAADESDLLPVVMLARIYASSGDGDRAMALIREANERNPTALLPNLMLATDALRQGDYSRADELASTAVENYPRSAEAFAMKGLAQMNLGDIVGFKDAFERASVLDPENVEYNYYLGKAAWASGQILEARTNFMKVVQSDNPYLPAMRSLAILHAQIGRTKQADQLVDDIRARFGQSRRASVAVGEIRAVQRKFEPAETAFMAAQSLEPSWYVASKLYELRNTFDHDDPTESLRAWSVVDPVDARPHLKMAQHFHQAGFADQAIEAYEKSLALNAESAITQNNLAWLYFERDRDGDRARALELAASAYAASDRHPAIADTYGWLLFRAGDTQKSRDILRTAFLATSPERSPDIAYHYAVLQYDRDGLDSSALEILENALKSEQPFSSRLEARQLRDDITERLEQQEDARRRSESDRLEQQRDSLVE